MPEYKATIMDSAAMHRALKRISHEIVERNNGSENICIVGIKRRGVPLGEIIAKNIYEIEGTVIPTGMLDITFYRDDLEKSSLDPVIHNSQIAFDITQKTVVLVDDVLYTGRTARAAMEALLSFGRARAIQLAVLCDRGHRELPIRGDFVGKNIPTSKSERVMVKLPPFDDVMAVQLFG